MTLKHNKKKNSLIVYEQLLTLATRLASNKKIDEFNFILETVKEFYSPNRMLGKEKKILQSITESSIKSEKECEDLISECLKEYSVIDHKRLDQEKVALINKINKSIGSNFFNIPVKKYKVYASAQILFNEQINGFKSSDPQERIRIKRILKENLSTSEVREENIEVDNVTYKILINKFNEKYGPFVNEGQKEILKVWLKSLLTEDKSELKKVLQQKIFLAKEEVSKFLKSKSSKSSENYELLIEAKQMLSSKDVEEKQITEDFIYEVMRYCDLVEDLKNES
jgi:hypothetical protein